MTAFTPVALLPLPSQWELDAVAGAPPLVRAVRALLGPTRLDQSDVVVCCGDEVAERVRSRLDEHALDGVLVQADATASRESVLDAGWHAVAGRAPSHVLVHDHRHPLVPTEVTDRVLTALRDGAPVVVPVFAMTDSVKAVDARHVVLGPLDRAKLLTAQYPRGFASPPLAGRVGATLAADGLMSCDHVTTVAGDALGARFNLPADAALLAAIIATSRPD